MRWLDKVLGRQPAVDVAWKAPWPDVFDKALATIEETRRATLPAADAARWKHRLYADTFGYFWKPCPICTEPFGGHEWSGAAVPTSGPGIDFAGETHIDSGEVVGCGERLVGICPRCEAAGVHLEYERRRTEERKAREQALEEAGWIRLEPAPSQSSDPATLARNASPLMTAEQAEAWVALGFDPGHNCCDCGRPMFRTGTNSFSCSRPGKNTGEHHCGRCGHPMLALTEYSWTCPVCARQDGGE